MEGLTLATLVYVALLVAAWVILNAWILPKFGIRT